MDRICEQLLSFRENGNKIETHNLSETVETCRAHNEEIGLGIYDTHRTAQERHNT